MVDTLARLASLTWLASLEEISIAINPLRRMVSELTDMRGGRDANG